MFVVKGLDAAILKAEMSVKRAPGLGLWICWPTIMWEEDTEENRKDKSLMWINSPMCGKYRFRERTPEELAQATAARRTYLLDVFIYLLENYGWEYAVEYYHRRKEDFDEVNIAPELRIPHCKYSKDKQCDMFCSFFNNGGCEYENGL